MILRRPTTRQLALGIAIVAILILADLLLPVSGGEHAAEAGHAGGGHGHEGWLGKIPFLGMWLGLLGAFALVLVAKTAGRLFVEKREDYYD